MRFSLFALALVLSQLLFLGSAFAVRHPSCGEESRIEARFPECGIEAHITAATAKCGVDLYNERQDKSCPGYVSRDEKRFSGSSSRPAPEECPSGYRQTEYTAPVACEECNNNFRWTPGSRTCVREESIPSCRKPEWGIERYKSCAHPAHGIASYKVCPRITHFDCRKPEPELGNYLARLEILVPEKGPAYVANKALVARLTKNASSMACIIKSWDGNVLYEEIVEQLKMSFEETMGRAYAPSDCKGDAAELFSCTAEDDGDICNAKKTLAADHGFFQSNLTELGTLLTDPLAKKQAARLQKLQSQINGYLTRK